MYFTADMAEDALIDARTRFEFQPNSGPVAIYQCEDCGQYHLTSQGKMNEKLALYLKEGKIKLQKEADRWMQKLKKR